jgi:rare lipoprotein A
MEGCARTISRQAVPFGAATASSPARSRTAQVGRASWYGAAHQGKRTASGEIYNQHDLTAAHPTLPLGSRAAVTNLDNGKTVEVRINDRGPFVDRRIIDLSHGAAQTIGLVKTGTARVRVKLLSSHNSSAGARYRKSRRQRSITKRECPSCQSQ